MKALYFDPTLVRAIPTKILSFFTKGVYGSRISPLIYGDVPIPGLPSEEWVRVRPRLAGVCGSDLAAITLKGGLDNPISEFISFPMYLGHEIVGEIDHPGEGVKGFGKGERVAVYPILACEPRGISPTCSSCERGDFALCKNFASGSLPPGQSIGVNNRTGGGFSECLVAHCSQLFRLPDTVPDEQAVLLDPLCVALHSVLLARPQPGHRVLVVGAGIIGLCVLQVLRALNIPCKIYVVARHAFQQELALSFGAHQIVDDTDDPKATARLAEELHARQYASRFVKPFFVGGFDVTYDCVGSARTIQKCTYWANQRGRVVLVGVNPPERFEWSLLFWKEVRLIGSLSYGMETIEGRRRHAFEIALEMIEQGRIRLDQIPVATYPVADYGRALKDLLHKGNSRLVKAALTHHPCRDALSCGGRTQDRSGTLPRP
jgi:threonine dehydrogenase-like Zn-dependent dehydrogenase